MKQILLIGLIIPLLFIAVSFRTMNDYGETTDEKASQFSGAYYYYEWNHQKSIKDYVNAFSLKDRNYGPFFDTISVASHDLFNEKWHFISNPVASYHIPVIIVSGIAIYLAFLYGAINWGLWPGVLASLTLALMPRFIGDSQNNLKDTPVLMLFGASVLLYFLAVRRQKIGYYLLAGCFLGLTYATKINALIILPVVGLWSIVETGWSPKKWIGLATGMAASLATAFVTILIAWPYYRYDPIHRFIETYRIFQDHEWNEYVLFMGTHYRGHEVPRVYPFVMFGVTTPIFFLILLGIAVIIWAYLLTRKSQRSTASALFLLFIWMLATPLTQALSQNPFYDGIRHYQTSLLPMSILIGFAVWYGYQTIRRIKRLPRYLLSIFTIMVVFGYSHVLKADIMIHPYQIVYFNELTGGVKGAYRHFDLDYWGQSLLEASHWVNTHLPDGARISVPTGMSYHFPIDSRFVFVEPDQDPQYKVNVVRGMLYTWDTDDNYLYPRRKPIYQVTVQGAPLLQIFALH